MTAPHNDFVLYCLELLRSLGPCTEKRLFGGWGISVDGLTVGLVTDLGSGQKLWLKAGPESRDTFEAAGCARFTYMARGVSKSIGFYAVPDECMESAQEMAPWARLALDAALAARMPKTASRTRPSKSVTGARGKNKPS
jgi:DNA transformation protein